MSETLKFNWNKDPDDSKSANPDIKCYRSASEVRHVTFVFLNGEHHTYYYFDLRRLVFFQHENKLVLSFSGDELALSGFNLQALHEGMRAYGVQEIKETEERYLATKKEDEIIVTKIEILKILDDNRNEG